jgi:predicted transcriptional regulator
MNKISVTFRLDPELLERLDKFQASLPYPASRTTLVEKAIEQMLAREAKKGTR